MSVRQFDMNVSRNFDSRIRLFADDYIVYKKITNKNDVKKLQKDLDSLGEWAVENGMEINPGKSKALRFTKDLFKNLLGYSPDEKNSVNEQLQTLENNFWKRFKLGGPSKLQSARSLQGTSRCNEFSQIRKQVYKQFSLHIIDTSYS